MSSRCAPGGGGVVPPKILEAFRGLDAGGSDTVDERDVERIFRRIGLGAGEIGTLLRRAPRREDDGALVYEQFLAWLFATPAGVPGHGQAAGQLRAGTCQEEAHAQQALPRPVGTLGSFDWRAHVDVPLRYLHRSVCIAQTQWRAITMEQLTELGDFIQLVLEKVSIVAADGDHSATRITWSSVNLYHINTIFVLPLTHDEQCPFVDLVAKAPQQPSWFVSHWWGTAFQDTLCMLGFHMEARGLAQETPYWICTFANNQHNLEELSQPDLLQTPFVQALLCDTCSGTLMLMNETAEPFRRSWCTLENYVSTAMARERKARHLLDIAAVVPDGTQEFYDPETAETRPIPRSAVLLEDDATGNLHDKVEVHGARFPADVSFAGVKVDIAAAKASRPEDKRHILRLIIGERNSSAQPPPTHPRYDEVNRSIQQIFAPRALFAAVMNDEPSEVARLLQSKLADPNWKNTRGSTCLLAAAFKDNVDVMRLMLHARADPDSADNEGFTPLSVAVEHGHTNTMALLLECRADPRLMSRRSSNPLEQAVRLGSLRAVHMLLDARADVVSSGGDPGTLHGLASTLHDRETSDERKAEAHAIMAALRRADSMDSLCTEPAAQ